MRSPESIVALLLLTYAGSEERQQYAVTTLRSALDNLSTSQPLLVHIADDGSPNGHTRMLREIAGGYGHVTAVSISSSDRGGYGRNYNLATQQLHLRADYVLPLEDDWQLMRPLNLDPLLDALDAGPIGCIRLGYLGFTREGGIKGRLFHRADQTFMLLDSDSDDPHVFAGHPRIETVVWERAVGPWPEQEEPGATEFAVCHRPLARTGVAWPLDLIPPAGGLFAHIGTRRSTE